MFSQLKMQSIVHSTKVQQEKNSTFHLRISSRQCQTEKLIRKCIMDGIWGCYGRKM